MKKAVKTILSMAVILSFMVCIVHAGTVNLLIGLDGKGSQLHFATALIKIEYPSRVNTLKSKIDGINEECKKLDNGGALDKKKLNAQFQSALATSVALRKDIGKIKTEDTKMKTAKNMLISGFELLESGLKDLKKVTVTKDLGLFESYRMKVNKSNELFAEGWTIITKGL